MLAFRGIMTSYRAVLSIAMALGLMRHRPSISPEGHIQAPRHRKVSRRYGGTIGGRRGMKRYAGEMARRVRQIERGQLTASNGLVSGAGGIKVNSHGQIGIRVRPNGCVC